MYLPDCVLVNQLVLYCILFGYSFILFGFREPSFLNKKFLLLLSIMVIIIISLFMEGKHFKVVDVTTLSLDQK